MSTPIPSDGFINVFARFVEWFTPSNSPTTSSPPSPTNATPSHSLSEGEPGGIWYINIHTGETSFALRDYSEDEAWNLV